MVMSNLKMDIYAGGLGLLLAWADEEQYQLGKNFLTDRGALFFAPSREGGPEFVYLKEKDDLSALLGFRKSLEEKGQT
jgi:hypothetical protein